MARASRSIVHLTLFQRGFSTRKHKSGGLGLHWCANSMTAMQGSLRLESEGQGRGAVAILALATRSGGAAGTRRLRRVSSP